MILTIVMMGVIPNINENAIRNNRRDGFVKYPNAHNTNYSIDSLDE